MKVAVSRRPKVGINAHFGYAEFFEIYDVSGDKALRVETRFNDPHCSDAGGDHDLLDRAADLVADCVAVVAGRIGPCARDALLARGIAAVEHDGPGLFGTERELAVVKDYVRRSRPMEAVPVEAVR